MSKVRRIVGARIALCGHVGVKYPSAMLGLKKALGLKGKEAENSLAPLTLSSSLCQALLTLSQIFGQTWHQHVVGELTTAMASGAKLSGQPLANVLSKLLDEAAQSRPGLTARFLIHAKQIVYRSEDRRYTVIMIQGESDTVRLVWQVSSRQAGASYIAYIVDGNTWKPLEWKISSACQRNLDLLAKIGGEVLGFLEEAKLLPTNSAFQKAMDAQLTATAKLRESSLRPRTLGSVPNPSEAAKPDP